MALKGKTVLITGAARRIGRELAMAAASGGANVILHYGHSRQEALETASEIETYGVKAWVIEADLENPAAAARLVDEAWALSPIFCLVNSAAIFEPLNFGDTTLAAWQRHLEVNLTAPFLLSQSFSRQLGAGSVGRIINLLDWRALRPAADHFPYTLSKAALASLTSMLAVALAPSISVNGLALGAILPPADGGAKDILQTIPAGRWAELDELKQAFLFLLDGPAYITGEILHLDGGRHLV